jgi:hypothetical protein
MSFIDYVRLAVNPANYHWSWHALPKFLEIAVNLGLGFFVFFKNSRARTNQAYLAVVVPISTWLIGFGVNMCVRDWHLSSFWTRNIAQLGVLFCPAGLFLFTSVFLGACPTLAFS